MERSAVINPNQFALRNKIVRPIADFSTLGETAPSPASIDCYLFLNRKSQRSISFSSNLNFIAMSRLVVNPAKPDAWEIELKPGVNRLGRGTPTISKLAMRRFPARIVKLSSDDGLATIQDLGSTNGTFINGARIQNAKLENGQTIRLGGAEMIFYSATAPPAVSPATARMRVSVIANAPASVPPVLAVFRRQLLRAGNSRRASRVQISSEKSRPLVLQQVQPVVL